jgi:predicted metalloendopeptidase
MDYCIPQNDLDCFYNRFWYSKLGRIKNPVNNFSLLEDKINQEMFDFIMYENETDYVYSCIQKLKSSYFNRNKSETINVLIKAINSISDQNKLFKMIKYLTFFGLNPLFDIGINPNFYFPDIYSIIICEIDLTLSIPEQYSDSRAEKSIKDIANLIYDNFLKEHEIFKQEFIDNIIMMEFLFAKTKISLKKRDDPSNSFHSILFSQFLNKFDSNDFWMEMLGEFFSQDQLIFFENENFLVFLDKLLNISNLKIIKHYLIYSFIRKLIMYTSSAETYCSLIGEIFDEKKIFLKTFYYSFGFYLENFYEKNHSNQFKIDKINQMFINLKNTCYDIISKSDFFSTKTRNKILQKISNLQIIIGKQKYSINLEQIPELEDDFYFNLFSINFFYFIQMTKLIGKSKNSSYLSINNDIFSFTMNAFYDTFNNVIYIPTSMTHDLFFNENENEIYNYGGLGNIIGHEIMHSFDKSGSQFDFNGHLNYWWNNEDIIKYQKELEKIEKHYGNIFIEKIKINSQLTVSENIADICGIKLSLKTYLRNHFRNIDIFNLSNKEKKHLQKFFQRWTEILRSAESNERIANSIEYESHAPSIVRMNAPFSHIDEYYLIYNVLPNHINYLHECNRVKILD